MRFLIITVLLFLFDIHADSVRNCQEEYLEGVGWKKIVYTDNGPIESIGRCKQEEDIGNIIITGLLIWGLYEIYSDKEPEQFSVYQTKNFTLLPLDEILITNNEKIELQATIFRFKF